MLRWFRSSRLPEDMRAVSAAMALAPFLWGLKIQLVWWMQANKGIHALADVPATSVPLLAAQDLVLCMVLAGVYWMLMLVARPLWKPVRVVLGTILPALIGCGVVFFAVVSWKVQQLYGCALEVAHLRAATGMGAMQDSIVAYLTADTIAFLLIGLVLAIFGGRMLRPVLAQQNWLLVRWRLWGCLVGGVLGLYALDKTVMKERYTYGIEQNAVLHFVKWYEKAPTPVDAAELLHQTPAQVISRDAEFRQFAPFAPMVNNAGRAPTTGPATASGLPLSESRPVGKFNVLIVLMESTPAVYIDREAAPNLTRLAESGLKMDHHFTSICETYKAVYSLFFSDYMVNLGSLPRVVYHRPMPQPSLPEVLHDHGYATAFYHSGFLRLGDLGFMLKGFDTQISADELQKAGAMGWRYGVFEEHTVDALSEWIRAHKAGPFFAVYSTMFPHHPYYSPLKERPFPSDTLLGRYRNALLYADQNVGKVLDLLETEKLKDNTLVIAVADHGETVASWPCGHGMNFSMEELHVPLILSNPKLIRPGTHSDLYTQHPDVGPTILGLLGIQSPPEWLGRNLCEPTVPIRAFPVTIEQAHMSGIVDNGLVYRLDQKSSRGALLRIEGEQLNPLSESDPAASLQPAYADRLSLFNPWVRWRHFRRVVEQPTATLAVH